MDGTTVCARTGTVLFVLSAGIAASLLLVWLTAGSRLEIRDVVATSGNSPTPYSVSPCLSGDVTGWNVFGAILRESHPVDAIAAAVGGESTRCSL